METRTRLFLKNPRKLYTSHAKNRRKNDHVIIPIRYDDIITRLLSAYFSRARYNIVWTPTPLQTWDAQNAFIWSNDSEYVIMYRSFGQGTQKVSSRKHWLRPRNFSHALFFNISHGKAWHFVECWSRFLRPLLHPDHSLTTPIFSIFKR